MIGTNDTQPANGKWWQRLATLDTRLYIVYGAGIAASFSALFELAVKYGGWLKPFGIALPTVIDVYWMTALQVALDSSRSNRERGWAAVHAFFAISLSITGNIMYHELDKGTWRLDTHAQGQLVAVLACIPVVLTGTLTHLVLLARTGKEGEAAAPAAAPAPASAVPADRPAAVQPRPATASGNQGLAPAGSREQGSALVPGTATPAPAVPAAGSGNRPALPVAAPGSGSGNQAPVPARQEQPVPPAPRPARLTATSPAPAAAAEGETEPSEDVIEEMKNRPRPLENADAQEQRALDLLAEFARRTGKRMNNQELGLALGMQKAKAGVLRKAIKDREPTEKEEAAA